jgi:tRNA (guanine37-N1)-methyltransferase
VRIDVVTIFPGYLAPLDEALVGRARRAGLIDLHVHDLRTWATGVHKAVDDAPYGGGPGMIMRVEPIAAALAAVDEARGPCHRILLTPQGRVFDQRRARALAALPRLALVCGRYEGIDERVGAAICQEQLSLGDFVLAGGELAAAAVIEAVARLVPGVLGCGLSADDESFSDGRLEYPQWTRPASWQGHAVPEVLLSGDHQAVARWRRREALRRTLERRPDLVRDRPLTDEEQQLLDSGAGSE